MENFSKTFLQKSLLLMVLFLGGCQLVPTPFFQYLLGDNTGITVYTDYTDYPTMYFTVNSDATSLTLYTTTSTNTLSYTDGDYKWGTYEGENFKLQLFNVDLKGGTFKLYKNGTLIDEDDFIWWIGDIDLKSYTRVLDTVAGRTTSRGLKFSDDGKTIYEGFNVVTDYTSVSSKDYVYSLKSTGLAFHLKEFTKEYATYTNTCMGIPFAITIENLVDDLFDITFFAETDDYYLSLPLSTCLSSNPELPDDHGDITGFDMVDSSKGYDYTMSKDFKTIYDNINDTSYTYYEYGGSSTITMYKTANYGFDTKTESLTINYVFGYHTKGTSSFGLAYTYPILQPKEQKIPKN